MQTQTKTVPEVTLKFNKGNFEKVKITNSMSAYQFIKQFYSDDIAIYESFFILLLNRQNKTIGWAKISQGGICGTVVDVKIICKYVVESLASSVILAHNHPSGNTTPSNPDIQITKKVKTALSYFDAFVADHIILSADLETYFSFADNGNL